MRTSSSNLDRKIYQGKLAKIAWIRIDTPTVDSLLLLIVVSFWIVVDVFRKYGSRSGLSGFCRLLRSIRFIHSVVIRDSLWSVIQPLKWIVVLPSRKLYIATSYS